MAEETLALFEDGGDSFEELAKSNGTAWWQSRDLMRALGYQGAASFEKVIRRAQQACLVLNIPVEDNFRREEVVVDGKPVFEYRLTRFACYLVAMNADNKKPQVAAAQVYFADLAQSFQEAIADSENVERVLIRDELSGGVKSLQSTASKHGVKSHAFFQNAGYRGMYNMPLNQLLRVKGVPKGKVLFDFMGRRELAANLFRVTQTEEKIRNERTYGQSALEHAAEDVGRVVRRTMIEIGGTPPERLPLREPVQKVRTGLRKTSREFRKLDSPKSQPSSD